MPTPYSFTVDGTGVSAKQWPAPQVDPSILWIRDSAGNWSGSDRGASQDAYTSEAVLMGTETELDSMEGALEDAREGMTLAAFAAPLFAPNVDHTGSISATVTRMGPRRHVAFGAGAAVGVYELPVTFRAISPTLLGTSPSLATLKLQDGFEADRVFEAGKGFTYSQAAIYSDHDSDVGRFRQQTSQAQAILAYLLTTARANTVAFPSIGVNYPWGNPGAPANCKVKSFTVSRVNFVFWDFKIELVEVV